MTQLEIFDVSAGKHGGNEQSKAANLIARPHKNEWHRRILESLRAYPPGLTCKEIAQMWGVEMHRVSGRVTELLVAGKVLKTSRVRDGGRVIVRL